MRDRNRKKKTIAGERIGRETGKLKEITMVEEKKGRRGPSNRKLKE